MPLYQPTNDFEQLEQQYFLHGPSEDSAVFTQAGDLAVVSKKHIPPSIAVILCCWNMETKFG